MKNVLRKWNSMSLVLRIIIGLALGVALALLVVAVGAWLGYGNGAALRVAGADIRAVIGSTGTVLLATTLLSAGAVALQAGWKRIAWRAVPPYC